MEGMCEPGCGAFLSSIGERVNMVDELGTRIAACMRSCSGHRGAAASSFRLASDKLRRGTGVCLLDIIVRYGRLRWCCRFQDCGTACCSGILHQLHQLQQSQQSRQSHHSLHVHSHSLKLCFFAAVVSTLVSARQHLVWKKCLNRARSRLPANGLAFTCTFFTAASLPMKMMIVFRVGLVLAYRRTCWTEGSDVVWWLCRVREWRLQPAGVRARRGSPILHQIVHGASTLMTSHAHSRIRTSNGD